MAVYSRHGSLAGGRPIAFRIHTPDQHNSTSTGATSAFELEYAKAIETLIPVFANTPQLVAHDIVGRRAALEGITSVFKFPESASDVEIMIHQCKSYDGASIPVYRFRPKDNTSRPTPAIVHFDGGGMIAGSVTSVQGNLSHLVSKTRVQLFSVDYRLAPENPYPTPLEDCYAALCFVSQEAQDFDADPTHIAVTGKSAGGGLAAATALLARDRNFTPKLAKQILIYPMLDDRTSKDFGQLEPYLLWEMPDNVTGWKVLLGDAYRTDDVSPYAAPGRMENLEGLPETYMAVEPLICFAKKTSSS